VAKTTCSSTLRHSCTDRSRARDSRVRCHTGARSGKGTGGGCSPRLSNWSGQALSDRYVERAARSSSLAPRWPLLVL